MRTTKHKKRNMIVSVFMTPYTTPPGVNFSSSQIHVLTMRFTTLIAQEQDIEQIVNVAALYFILTLLQLKLGVSDNQQ